MDNYKTLGAATWILMTDFIKTVQKYKTLDGYRGWIIKIRRTMQILVGVEELEGEVIAVKARKLPPDYEPETTDFHGLKEHTFREFTVEVEDYRPEDFNRDKEWKEIHKAMKRKK